MPLKRPPSGRRLLGHINKGNCVMSKRILIVLTMLLCASGCAGAGPVVDECDAFAPITVDEEAVATLPIGLVEKLLRHNEIGARLCGWRPRES